MKEVSGGHDDYHPAGGADCDHGGEAEQPPGKLMFFSRRIFDLANVLIEAKMRQPDVPVFCDNQYVSHDSMRGANFVPHLVMDWTDYYLTLYQSA